MRVKVYEKDWEKFVKDYRENYKWISGADLADFCPTMSKGSIVIVFHDDYICWSAELHYDKEYKPDKSENNGGSTDYYKIPEGAKDAQDIIEYKKMNFAQGNIFKAIYRAGECPHSDYERELNKIIWFANRELDRIKKEEK